VVCVVCACVVCGWQSCTRIPNCHLVQCLLLVIQYIVHVSIIYMYIYIYIYIYIPMGKLIATIIAIVVLVQRSEFYLVLVFN